VELVPKFFLSATRSGFASKALVGHCALDYHNIFYYKVCNIVDVVLKTSLGWTRLAERVP
jgi:hypothetical protein